MVVSTITIDAVTAGWRRLDLIKMDVEGAEVHAYHGARQTIARFPNVVIVMEVNTARLGVEAAQAFYAELASDWPVLCRLVGPRALRTSPAQLLANRVSDDMLVLTRNRLICA